MTSAEGFERFSARVLEKDGCPLHYWSGGDPQNPPVVLLHGAGTDHKSFSAQLPALGRDYRILAWDARGHGLSRPIGAGFSFDLLTDDLLAVMDREEVASATFIGHSMGGNLAQVVAVRQPDRVDALVLIDCTRNTGTLGWSDRVAVRLAPRILAWYPWGALVSAASHASSTRPEVRRYMAECFRVLGHRDFTRVFLETARCLHPDPHYRFGKPMLIVAGDQDPTGNIKQVADRWAREEDQATHVLIANAGHAAHQDNPRAVNDAIVEFLWESRRPAEG
ncbi:MAG: alpha/beta fold hydrolase [Firmicutes bacterium]|nr:alpha/beta fold hydrolase [Bacillota bacterium]